MEPEPAQVEGQVEAQPSEPDDDVPGEQAEEPLSEEEAAALRRMISPKQRSSYLETASLRHNVHVVITTPPSLKYLYNKWAPKKTGFPFLFRGFRFPFLYFPFFPFLFLYFPLYFSFLFLCFCFTLLYFSFTFPLLSFSFPFFSFTFPFAFLYFSFLFLCFCFTLLYFSFTFPKFPLLFFSFPLLLLYFSFGSWFNFSTALE